jgi:hypothetical protein
MVFTFQGRSSVSWRGQTFRATKHLQNDIKCWKIASGTRQHYGKLLPRCFWSVEKNYAIAVYVPMKTILKKMAAKIELIQHFFFDLVREFFDRTSYCIVWQMLMDILPKRRWTSTRLQGVASQKIGLSQPPQWPHRVSHYCTIYPCTSHAPS